MKVRELIHCPPKEWGIFHKDPSIQTDLVSGSSWWSESFARPRRAPAGREAVRRRHPGPRQTVGQNQANGSPAIVNRKSGRRTEQDVVDRNRCRTGIEPSPRQPANPPARRGNGAKASHTRLKPGGGPESAHSGVSSLEETLAAAVEALGTNVFMADRDLRITFLNRKARETMESMRSVLQAKFGLTPEQLVGVNIDTFHGGRATEIRRRLSDPANLPVRSEIKLGNLVLGLNVHAVYDRSGEFVATVVNWEQISEKKRLEIEASRAQSMLEDAPINVIMADRDFKIRYLNPASLKTLKSIQHLLPVPADQILGQSIDIFHKNPARQRGIVGEPKNLPHSANIKLGDETLSLLVSPIFDSARNYLGPMVTWEVITGQLATKQREKDLEAERERAAADLRQKVDAMLAVVQAAAQGDLTSEIPVSGQDAIGQMGDGLRRLLDSSARA